MARTRSIGGCWRRVVAMVAALGVTVLAVAVLAAGPAWADGDPGSDVLVNQPLFLASDAGIDVAQQTQLSALLSRAQRSGLPVRVAIIAQPDDLGAITPLWRKPQSYAQFLGTELSLVFKGPLLVVMPNGFGVWWPGHGASLAAAQRRLATVKVGSGADGLVTATTAAVQQLAAASGVRLSGNPAPSSATGSTGSSATGGAARAAQGGPTILSTSPGGASHSADLIAAIVVALAAIVLAGWFIARSGAGRRAVAVVVSARAGPSGERGRGRGLVVWGLPGVSLVAVAVLAALLVFGPPSSSSQPVSDLANAPYLDPGTALPPRPAPNFTLYDQFGKRVTLRQYRGKVVLLAFIDSECTTICPLTTTAMLDAKRLLGAAGSQVALVGIDANPKDTQIDDVLSYSQLHGLTHSWQFETGTLAQLRPVWRHYYVQADIEHGLISHTAALYVIDPSGRERELYTTGQSYTAVPQLGQLLAHEASRLLPSHPAVASHLSYGQVPTVPPTFEAELPRSGGGTVRIGRGAPRLYAFFDTWVREVMPLGGDLDGLNGYAAAATADGLPSLVAVDEGSVEPSPSALPNFLGGLSTPLRYPVAVDNTGRVADGYEVQGEPWLVLTSSTGKVLWYDEPDTSGWPTTSRLEADVRHALTPGPAAPTTEAAALRELAGSPAPLAALHERASQLLGGEPALAAEIRALRGYPIVVNIWASWCPPCRAEFGLFANASAHYGRSIAFLGADYNDSPGDAQAFLRQHPVSYPSYQMSPDQVGALLPGGVQATPTTVYITPSGHVSSIHIGVYESQGALDGDIQTYATNDSGAAA